MQIADHVTAVDVSHDVLDRGKSHVHMRGVMHHQNDSGYDLHPQAEGQHNAPNPHPIKIFGCGQH